MNERGKSRVGLSGRSNPEIRNQQVGGSSPLAGSTITLPFDKDLQRAPLRHALSHRQIMLATSDQMSTESVSNDGYHRAPRPMR